MPRFSTRCIWLGCLALTESHRIAVASRGTPSRPWPRPLACQQIEPKSPLVTQLAWTPQPPETKAQACHPSHSCGGWVAECCLCECLNASARGQS
eukprot:scaffold58777_cov38-Prasinocladus_malaysianus.AAC.1